MTNNVKEKIEDKVIDLIALGSSGRLIVFKPEKSDKHLVIARKGDYKNRIVFLNVYGDGSLDDKGFAEIIGELTKDSAIVPESGFYLLVVHFDIIKQEIGDELLVIPSADLLGLEGRKDFSEYLLSKEDFVRLLISEVEKK